MKAWALWRSGIHLCAAAMLLSGASAALAQTEETAFARNSAGDLIQYYWSAQPGWAATNLTKSPLIGTAFRIASDPQAITLEVGHVETRHVFARNGAGDVIHYYWSAQPGWRAENLTSYPNIGTAFRVVGGLEVLNSGETQHVFARTAAGDLVHYVWSAAAGWAAEDLTTSLGIGTGFRIASDPKALSASLEVFARNASSDLIHYYRTATGWAAENLTRYPNIGAAMRIAGNPAVSTVRTGSSVVAHVFGRSAGGDLIHYYWTSAAGWRAENLTQRSNIGTAFRIISDPRELTENVTQRVFARNPAGHVIEYRWTARQGWSAADITPRAALQVWGDVELLFVPGVASELHAFARNFSGDLVHFFWSQGAGWDAENLTGYANIGTTYRIVSDPRALSNWASSSVGVFGRSTDGHLMHYYWTAQPGWAAENLTRYANIGTRFSTTSQPDVLSSLH
jgi:hypothetical protein